MVLTYQGDNYFKIQSGSFTILIDPTNQRSMRGANLVLNTLKPSITDNFEEEKGPVWIENQGEYEVGGVDVRAVSLGKSIDDKAKAKEKTAYRVLIDDISIGILGYLKEAPNETAMELLGGVDMLIVPAGGKPLISGKNAAVVAKALAPKMIILSLTQNPKEFLNELEEDKIVPEEKLTLKKKDFEGKELEVHILKI